MAHAQRTIINNTVLSACALHTATYSYLHMRNICTGHAQLLLKLAKLAHTEETPQIQTVNIENNNNDRGRLSTYDR